MQNSRLQVFSEQVGGGDRYWFDALGLVSGLHYSKTYPGGDCAAQWQMQLDPKAQHRAWAPGREIGISCGASIIWRGLLDNPQRGVAWQFNAVGRAADANRYLAIAPTSGNALDLYEMFTAANTRGLGWSLPASGAFPELETANGITPSVPSATIYCSDALAQVLAGQAAQEYWQVDTNLRLTFGSGPTVPSAILLSTDVGGGRSLEDFVTDVVALYQFATGLISTVTASATTKPFGVFEAPLDLTSQGLIPSAQAEAAAATDLAHNGARVKFVDPFTVTKGRLINIGGQPIDLATFAPGSLFNVIVTDPDSAGEVALSQIVQCVAGFTDYDVDSGVLTLGTTDSTSDVLPSSLFAGTAA